MDFIGSRYDREHWRAIWAKYLGLVKLLDDEVGRVIKALKDEGLYDKAIILFTADLGEMLGSHMLWQKMVNVRGVFQSSAHHKNAQRV